MKLKLFVIGVVGLLILLSGCVEVSDTDQDQDGDIDTEAEMSAVEFRVTDKVTEEFAHVNVTFSEIKLFKQVEDDEAYVVITLGEKTVDLVYLNLNNINETLGIEEIEVGNYSKLWINVTKAIGILNETRETKNITVPSGWLKIQQLHLFNIQKGNHTITVDINLEDSIHTFHGGEEYKFVPVISRIEHHHEKELKFREQDQDRIKNMVGNRKPAIDIMVNDSLVKNQITLDADVNYTFNASGTLDLDGDNLTYTWDFGDGTTDTGSVVVHSFTDDKNTYQVWLTVNDGQEDSTEHITVKINQSSGQGNGQGNGQN